MNKYKNECPQYEKRGREIMKKIFDISSAITDYEFTEGEYDNVDMYFTSAGTQCVGELKYRIDYNSDSYIITKYGVMIDEHKLLGMLNQDKVPFYIMIFPDKVGYRFRLDEIDFSKLEKKSIQRQKTTVGENRNIITRNSYILPLALGHKFSFKKLHS